jgi:hypothetical protein
MCDSRISGGLEKLLRIGPKPNVLQIVPPPSAMRRAIRRESDNPDDHDLVVHPLASPIGPGGAKGFRNRAGSTIQKPQVMNIYLGTFWGDQTFVEAFSKAIVENGYLDPLRELNYGTGSGVYLGSVPGPAPQNDATFEDAEVRDILKRMLDAGTIHGDANSLFMLILPDGIASAFGDQQSCQNFCGYHDAFPYNGTDIGYAILPSTLCKGCGGEIGDFTAIYGHELAEACTDKVPGKGWVADDGQENGDLEAWILFGWGPASDPNRYTIQGYYTNERGNTVGKWRETKAAGGAAPLALASRQLTLTATVKSESATDVILLLNHVDLHMSPDGDTWSGRAENVDLGDTVHAFFEVKGLNGTDWALEIDVECTDSSPKVFSKSGQIGKPHGSGFEQDVTVPADVCKGDQTA